jgi:hypothetical protein
MHRRYTGDTQIVRIKYDDGTTQTRAKLQIRLRRSNLLFEALFKKDAAKK